MPGMRATPVQGERCENGAAVSLQGTALQGKGLEHRGCLGVGGLQAGPWSTGVRKCCCGWPQTPADQRGLRLQAVSRIEEGQEIKPRLDVHHFGFRIRDQSRKLFI